MALTGGDLARKRLSDQERRDFAYFLAEFIKIRNRMSGEIDDTVAALESLKKAGEKLDPAILAKNARLVRLLEQIEGEINRLAPLAAGRVVDAKRTAVAIAKRQAAELPSLTADLSLFDSEATTEFLRLAGDGQPLRVYFERLAEPVRETLFGRLAYGLAAGLPNATIAREINDSVQSGAVRAMTIARTETNRAYREASRKFYDAEPSVKGWRWMSVQDLNTCPICWRHHGQVFATMQPFQTHPNCRCVMIPVIEIAEPVEIGSVAFAKLTDAQQKTILGPKRFELYKQGATLVDFIGAKDSPFGRTPIIKPLLDVRFVRRVRDPEPEPVVVVTPAATPEPTLRARNVVADVAPAFDAAAIRETFVAKATAIRGDYVDRTDELKKVYRDAVALYYKKAPSYDEQVRRRQAANAAKLEYEAAFAAKQIQVTDERALLAAADPIKFDPVFPGRVSAKEKANAAAGVQAFGELVDRKAWPAVRALRFRQATGRAHYQNETKTVFSNLKDPEGYGVFVHEVGHALEMTQPHILKAANEFLDRRTAGEKLVRLKDLYPTYNYTAKEITRKDKFPDAYTGKLYGSKGKQYATEVVSMGLEYMRTDPLKFARADPDYFEFILKVMRGELPK